MAWWHIAQLFTKPNTELNPKGQTMVYRALEDRKLTFDKLSIHYPGNADTYQQVCVCVCVIVKNKNKWFIVGFAAKG